MSKMCEPIAALVQTFNETTTLLLRVRAIGLPSNYAMKRKKQERQQNKTERNRKHKPIKGHETSI
ncbi:MAG: hypothetical protein HXN55_08620 [Prevotella nigrescens]|uniref:Uncharacterized protein n=1 Tax=Prevotella nigrescens TaxID=28133 RepID=A0A9D5WWT7_9BACT|nr:hypothetical protein [Prevotella nigrescens]MBF1447428.1 hypothetical protein [Prevotella nigrescens]